MPQFETEKPNLPVPTQAQRDLAELRRKKELARQNQSEQNALAVIPNHICLTIDASGSMDSPLKFGRAGDDNPIRLDAARTAMRAIVSASDPKTTAYSLIQFGSRANLLVPKTTHYLQIQAAVFNDHGGTDMEGGLFLSIQQTPTRIIMLSDGDVYRRPESAVAEAKKRNIIIDTVSIGEANDELMKWIAAETGGTWSRCDDVDSLVNQFLLLEPSNYLQLEHK